MSRYRFAAEIGCTPSYVTRLCKSRPPYPNKRLAKRIGEVTKGWVTPSDLAGYRVPDPYAPDEPEGRDGRIWPAEFMLD